MADKKIIPGGITRRQFIKGAGAVVAVGVVAGMAACVDDTTEVIPESTPATTTTSTTAVTETLATTSAITTTTTTTTTTATPTTTTTTTPVSTTTPTTTRTTTTTPTPTKTTTPRTSDVIGAAPVITHDTTICAGCGVCGLMCSFAHETEFNPTLSRSFLERDPFEANYIFKSCQQCLSPSCYFACPQADKAFCIDANGTRYIDAAYCDGCGKCRQACPFDPPRIKINQRKNVAFQCDLCRGQSGGPVCVQYCTMKALKLTPAKERS
ncbi:MAG: twin-arginine translocation signal domain-containing protein [Dehalococcoidales bacterium]|nr:twin-arginine translocation signal domain-containing protein [Dehalococcoidales bacterium]